MTYKNFIQNILDTRGRFGVPENEYKEQHHIIPECMGGETVEDNLIDLYADEHYIAHFLLLNENKDNEKLAYAFWSMTIGHWYGSEYYKISANEYKKAKELYSKVMSNKFSGSGNPNYGSGTNHWTKESSKKYKERHSGKNSSLYGKNPRLLYGAGVKKGYKHNEKAKNNMRLAKIGTHLTEETKLKISIANSGKKKPWLSELNTLTKRGKIDSYETKLKKSIATRGGNNPRALSVKCIETNEEFECIKYANKKYNIGKGLINKCCKGELETAGGYHWEYINKGE